MQQKYKLYRFIRKEGKTVRLEELNYKVWCTIHNTSIDTLNEAYKDVVFLGSELNNEYTLDYYICTYQTI